MANLDDLIKYENENTSLDFKAVQYKKEQHEELIKDIMSMANAEVENDRYIIVGLKHKPNGEREILGIEKEDFIDPATYQQLIRENVEPEINFDYIPYELENKLLGVFKISKCLDKPYMMKKDFKDLKKGDCFIRKGSQQYRMTRRDFDRIVEKRIKSANRKEPKLSLYKDIIPTGTESGSKGIIYSGSIIVGIENSGSGTAKYPFLALKVNNPPYELSKSGLDNGRTGLPRLPKSPNSSMVLFGGDANIVIHPNSILEITKIDFKISKNAGPIEDLVIEWEITAEEMRSVSNTKIIPGSEIMAKVIPAKGNI